MKLAVLSTISLFLLLGLAQAISFPQWGQDGKGGIDLGSFWPAELFDKIAGDLRSTYVSQVLPAFHVFKGEMKKIETVFQDADLATKVAEEFKRRTSKLQAEFQFPVANETATHHELLMQAVDKVMDVLDAVTEDVGKNLNTDVGHVRQAFQDARQPVKDVVLFSAKIIDDHPCLFELVALTLVLEIPGLWLIQPILGVVGFSTNGPVKGTLAARIQSKVYGARVPKGSVFSKLQKAGMSGFWVSNRLRLGTAAAVAQVLARCNKF
ncbi:hypothetical protein FA13DRAFT_1726126 [Coprinellus micaceus]|uniref:Uncharacterized protein n=1 Tax=Coprinellus micaceus TaxID=71717 RepID=A0A4Y7TWB4_COPMI|nr:hypothetical protein FA13DRAFT_1726126 [Coprinellus micaceus]